MYKVTFPYRVMAMAGIKTMIITCTVGGTNFNLDYPAIITTTDFINYFGTDPHVGM
jgi:purine nucleoside phosphorylase